MNMIITMKANRIAKKCLKFMDKYGSQNSGLLLTLLAFQYLLLYNSTKDELINSLSNSLDDLLEDDKN